MNTLRRFDNIKDFATHGLDFPIYPKQLQILSELFGEVCWTCTAPSLRAAVWSRHDLSYNVRLLRRGLCPHCGTTRTKQIADDPKCFAPRGSYMVGQRGGSTLMGCVASLYAEHRMLTLSRDDSWCSPQSYFGLPQDAELSQLIVVTSGRDVISFLETRNSLRGQAPWFRELDTVRNAQGEGAYDLRLDVVPSDTVATLRGKTAYFSLVDSADWMRDPIGVHTTLQNCLRTLYNECSKQIATNADTWNPCLLSYSARRDRHDFLLHQHFRSRFGLLDPKHIVGIVPTWDMNPAYNKAVMLRVHEHTEAARDFGCVCADDMESLFRFVEEHFQHRNPQ